MYSQEAPVQHLERHSNKAVLMHFHRAQNRHQLLPELKNLDSFLDHSQDTLNREQTYPSPYRFRQIKDRLPARACKADYTHLYR
ncbi:hypothetical protein D3C84_688330 [compost metagenome]